MADRPLDVIVYGATGFVGRLTASYLAASAPAGARIGLGGRSRERLEEVRQRIGGPAAEWPLVVADSGDAAAVTEMARQARVVATTVGPYAAYGMELARACAREGTHYADLTGEVLFMRRTADELGDVAAASGARIVHACGFDSIPSDLGVLVLHERAAADGLGDLTDTTLAVTAMRGGLSGGTFASMKGQLETMTSDRSSARLLADPYALSPARDEEPDRVNAGWAKESDLRAVAYDRDLGMWMAPFVMAAANTRVVRRSNALAQWSYGRRFRYREVMGFRGMTGAVTAAGVTGGIAAFLGAMSLPLTRRVVDRFLPEPGEGPSQQVRERGFFRIEIASRTSTGARLTAHVAASGDPGYKATSVMLGESALALAFDADKLPPRAGVLTPASGIGTALVERLRAQGFTFDVRRS